MLRLLTEESIPSCNPVPAARIAVNVQVVTRGTAALKSQGSFSMSSGEPNQRPEDMVVPISTVADLIVVSPPVTLFT